MCPSGSTRAALAATALLLLAAGPARAINEMFAKDAPISRMTEADLKIASEAIRKALDAGQEGKRYEWKNEATSASGSVTPGSLVERDGMRCRGASFVFTAKGVTSKSDWYLCLTPDGWKVWKAR